MCDEFHLRLPPSLDHGSHSLARVFPANSNNHGSFHSLYLDKENDSAHDGSLHFENGSELSLQSPYNPISSKHAPLSDLVALFHEHEAVLHSILLLPHTKVKKVYAGDKSSDIPPPPPPPPPPPVMSGPRAPAPPPLPSSADKNLPLSLSKQYQQQQAVLVWLPVSQVRPGHSIRGFVFCRSVTIREELSLKHDTTYQMEVINSKNEKKRVFEIQGSELIHVFNIPTSVHDEIGTWTIRIINPKVSPAALASANFELVHFEKTDMEVEEEAEDDCTCEL